MQHFYLLIVHFDSRYVKARTIIYILLTFYKPEMKLKNIVEKSRIGYDMIDTKISIFPRTIIFTANNTHSTFGL